MNQETQAHQAQKTEHKNDNYHQELINRLSSIEDRFTALEKKLDPMYNIFTSVQGFNGVSVWVFKFLAGAGAVIVGFYAILEFIKKIGK